MNTTKLPQDTEAPAVGGPVERMVRPLRVAAAILVPLMVLAAATGMAALTRWLDQFLAGKATMWLLLAALLAWMAWAVWNWPDWRDDESA